MSILHLIFIIALVQVPVNSLYHRDVTAKSFDTLLDPSKAHLLIEFYAPWCGHCKSLAPEYELLGETFASSADVMVAQVDADKHKELASRFGVSGFPTLKWVAKGTSFDKAEDVNSARTAEEMLKYINDKTGLSKKLKGAAPSSVTEISPANVEALTSGQKSKAFIGFFAPWCGHCKSMKPIWENLSQVYADEADVTIGAIDCDAHKDLCSKHEVEGFPTLKFFSAGASEKYEGGRSIDDFVTFINSQTGLDFSADGGVSHTAGIIPSLNEHVDSYLKASTADERANVLNTCTEHVGSLDDHTGNKFKYYSKVFAKIEEKGLDYIKAEISRLSKVLDSSGSLKSAQRRSFLRRINVLNVFDKN